MSAELKDFQLHTNKLLDAIALIPDRARNTSIAGEWSAAYIIHHLADGELHFAARYLHTIGSDNPLMIYFEEERYPDALKYEERTVAKSLASIVGIRAMVLEVLSTQGEEAWSRTTTTVDGSTFTLAQLVAKAGEHIVAHTEQLKTLASQL